nr:hypothetical protein [Tanacetum cinerariifolium]
MTSFGYRLNPRYAIKECSSCGALYTRDCSCSKGNIEDKILVPKPPKNCARCAKCGHPVNCPYYQGCALLREKLEEDLVLYLKYFQESSESSDDSTNELEENLVTYSPDFQNSFEPSNASTNVVNAPREPYVVKQDNGSFVDKIIFDLNRAPDSPDQFHCFHCKDVLRDGKACKRCTCVKCGSVAQKKLEEKQIEEERAAKSKYWRLPISYDDDDDDDEERSDSLDDNIISGLPSILLTFSTQLRNFLSILVNSAGTMLIMVTIVHLKFCLSIRNRVTIKTLISRKIFTIFNNKIFVVKIVGLLMKLTNEEEKQTKEEQVANARYWKIPSCYDDDDDDYTFAITPNEPDNSLSMRDEHL